MELLKGLQSLREELRSKPIDDDGIRSDMLLEARQLMLDLERPHDTVYRIDYQHMEAVVCNIAIKTGLFKALEESAATSAELAAKCGVDQILIGRVLRCLAAHGAIDELKPELYRSNAVSRTFTEPHWAAMNEFQIEFHNRSWAQMPSFLQSKGWKNWTSSTDTPSAVAWNKPSGGSSFNILNERSLNEVFNLCMEKLSEGHQQWTDIYPVRERLGGAELGNQDVVMVDVGGGLGHQAQKLREQFRLPGRYIVQDFKHTFPKTRPEGIEYMEHDFFTEQPVRGARAYYLRFITHDWGQEQNEQICTEIRKAMTPGYSRLIINDWILPDRGATMYQTSMDLCMLCFNGGMERTESLHREYLERAGLRVTKVCYPGDSISEGVIEAEVAV